MAITPDPFVAPALTTPEEPPLVGVGSPWAPANGENRDRILDWWRSWWSNVFFPWVTTLTDYLNTWFTNADTYIETYAVAGHSWWSTDTAIADPGPTTVTITGPTAARPLTVGDLVVDTTTSSYGEITSVLTDTTATVTYVGTLQGVPGPNTIPTDTAVAGLVPGPSLTNTALDTYTDTYVGGAVVDPTTIIGGALETVYVPTIMLTGAGIDPTGVTDSTVAIQAMIDANPGGTLQFPVGVFKFTNLTLNEGQHLKGSGWHDVYTSFGFASADWTNPANFSGTVLRSTAATGDAIQIIPIGTLAAIETGHLSEFIFIGPGSGAAVGIRIGGITGIETVMHPVWRHIKVGNFPTGVKMGYVNEGSFYDLIIHGCQTPLNLFDTTNQNAFHMLDIQRNTGPALIASGRMNAFYSPILQSNTGTGMEVTAAKTLIAHPYTENNGFYAIDIIGGLGTTIISPHLQTANKDNLRIQAAAQGVSVIGFGYYGGLVTNAGKRTYLQGEFNGTLTDTGIHTTLIDATTAWKTYTPVWTAVTTNPVLGDGTLTGQYMQIGKTVHWRISLTPGSTTTFGAGAYFITLPVTGISTAGNVGSGFIAPSNVAVCIYAAGGTFNAYTNGGTWAPTVPTTLASGNKVNFAGSYEVAQVA